MAAIKFLISTLRKSTKEYYYQWPDEDGYGWCRTSCVPSTCDTDMDDGQRSQMDDENASKMPEDTGPPIQDIVNNGNFCTAIVPFGKNNSGNQSWAERRRSLSRLRIGTPFGRDIDILLGFRELNFLKLFFNNILFDHSNDDRSLVRYHQIVTHNKPEATLTEIMESTHDIEDGDQALDGDLEADGDVECNDAAPKSLESEGNDDNDAKKAKAKPPRKKKLYTCFQCPKT